MSLKLYKAAEVCVLAQLQPYVLRSWEKEFPGIGVQRGPDGPRLYRQADVDQVLRIKQLVFTEGLTLAGARRKIEELAPPAAASAPPDDSVGMFDTLADDAGKRVAAVRDGLRAILALLSQEPGAADAAAAAAANDEYQLEPPVAAERRVRALSVRREVTTSSAPAVAAKRKRASA